MTAKIIILIFWGTLCSVINVEAQMGIGTNPKSSSILDLTNNSNKYLILPVTYGNPDTILQEIGSVIYYNDNIYLRTSDGIKVFSPWKWDGDSSHAISSPLNSKVGISISPNATDSFVLQIDEVSGNLTDITSNGSLLIGTTNTNHLFADNYEIMAKSSPTDIGELKMQEEGGTVVIRSPGSDANENTVLTTYGSLDSKGKVKENGKDLVPVGSIFMWSGDTVPAGWALCDGGTYPLQDGTNNITTPNLMDKFILGSNITGTGNTGGNNSSAHNHSVDFESYTNPADGSHSHTITAGNTTTTIPVNCLTCSAWNFSYAANNHNHTINNSTHSHTIDFLPQLSSLSTNTENRPLFYSLAFIMKL